MADLDLRIIVPVAASHPELGRLLWGLEDARARTIRAVDGLGQTGLDWTAPGVPNSIGSLLYHIALIEADYLYADTLRVDFPDWLKEVLPFPYQDAAGRLSVVAGASLEEHVARLDRIRGDLLRLVATLSAEELTSNHAIPEFGYETSPAWVMHNLMQHEAEHRGEINAVRTLFEHATV